MLARLLARATPPTRSLAALTLVAAATLAAAPARAQAPAMPQESFSDLNDTLMHYYLTSAYNVRADLQRAKEFALRYDLPRAITFNLGGGQGGRGLDVGSKRRTGFFLTFRGDKLYEGGGDDDGGVDDLNVAYEYLSQDDGKSWAVHAGVALIEYRQVGANAGAKYINMLVGFDTAVGDLFKLGADVSVNAATEVGQASAKHRDFDQLSTYLDIPKLGAFGSFRYDLGSKVPRDAEAGFAWNLEDDGLGLVRVAFSRRFAYALTGTFFRGGYAGTGQPDRTLEADTTVILRWDRVEATTLGGRKLLVSAGAAGGTVPKLLRFAFVEANLQLDGWGLFGRAGAAYGRVQGETVAGVSGGLESSFADGAVIGRLASGRRDWEVVDRVGSSDRNALMLFVGGGWGSDAPKRKKQEET